ncbi:uncharacterized protein [Littorina saxatilis]|uniref:uncharacterized protein n=1 Tax=Littorina saxatilis TaxID=31220 RepID=UPI0038B443ED
MADGTKARGPNNAEIHDLQMASSVEKLSLNGLQVPTQYDLIKQQHPRSDSLADEAIAYDDMNKPETRAMEVQPDLSKLEPRNDPRAFMPFAPIPTRRYTSLPFESQRRLIPVPEEEGSADERLTSPEEIFSFPVYARDIDDDFCMDVDFPIVPMCDPLDTEEEDAGITIEVQEKT